VWSISHKCVSITHYIDRPKRHNSVVSTHQHVRMSMINYVVTGVVKWLAAPMAGLVNISEIPLDNGHREWQSRIRLTEHRASTGESINMTHGMQIGDTREIWGPNRERAVVKYHSRGTFNLLADGITERSRWGTAAEIERDADYFIAYGRLPEPDMPRW